MRRDIYYRLQDVYTSFLKLHIHMGQPRKYKVAHVFINALNSFEYLREHARRTGGTTRWFDPQ